MRIPILIAAVGLAACAPQYSVTELDKRFSADKSPVYLARGNRISSRSIVGGYHIDEAGLYMNPYVAIDDETGAALPGLQIVNVTGYDTRHGAPNALGYISEITFRFPGGGLLTLPVTGQGVREGDALYVDPIRWAGYDIREVGIARMNPSQFARLAAAERVSVQVRGSRQTAIYEEGDVSASFLENLRRFYEQYVRPATGVPSSDVAA